MGQPQANPAGAMALLQPGTLSYALLEALGVWALHVLAFYLLFDSNRLPLGVDGFYHFLLASQLSLSQLAASIELLPFTVLGPDGPDAHWLIHWLQKPFTLLPGTPAEALALASLLWAALLPALLTLLLRLAGVPLAPLFAIIGCWGLYILPERYLMFRAQNIAVVLVALVALLAAQRKLLWLALALFLFNHSYQGVILAGAVIVMAMVAEGMVWRRFNSRMATVAIVAVFLSLLSSPWFPDNIGYFLAVTLGRLVLPIDDASLMGTEWYSLQAGVLLKSGLVAHSCLLAAATLLVLGRKHIPRNDAAMAALVFTLMAMVFLLLYGRHWRMGEFYGPFAAMALGFTLLWYQTLAKPRLAPIGISALLALCAAHQALMHPKQEFKGEQLQAQCQYLQTHARPGELVFNTAWSQFTRLAWCAPEQTYIAGLDGMLLAQGDGDLFTVWYYLHKGALNRLSRETLLAALQRSEARYMLVRPAANSAQVTAFVLRQLPGAQVVVKDTGGTLIALPPLSPQAPRSA